MKNKAIIGISMGDPAGIGPEIIVKFLKKYYKKINADIKIYGSPAVLHKAAANFAESVSFKIIETGNLSCRDFIPGKLSAKCGVEALNAVEKMTQDAINGRIDALVTAPVNKAAINLAGIPFTGHTEFIADMCGTTDFAMMQSSGTLRIAFVTTHIPLAKVPSSISLENIIHTAKLLYDAVKADGISSPLIVLAGINPHAGEDGFMGKEDEQIVKPAVAELNKMGIRTEGPFPSDTLFIKSTLEKYDGIVSMYHDQGHIPFKMLAFENGVNSTLGLPIIRTSVDHGTAFPIAWQGKADIGSLAAAVKTAVKRAEYRGMGVRDGGHTSAIDFRA